MMNGRTIKAKRGMRRNKAVKAIKQKGSKGKIESEIMASLDAYAANWANKLAGGTKCVTVVNSKPTSKRDTHP